MVLINNIKINDLYFIIYKSKEESVQKLLKEQKMKNVFFDIVLTSKPENIKYSLHQMEIKKIIPAINIAKFYKEMEEKKVKFFVFDKKWLPTNEVAYEDLMKQKVLKENIELFMTFINKVKNGEIEPIYLPFTDEEKEKSFIY